MKRGYIGKGTAERGQSNQRRMRLVSRGYFNPTPAHSAAFSELDRKCKHNKWRGCINLSFRYSPWGTVRSWRLRPPYYKAGNCLDDRVLSDRNPHNESIGAKLR